MIGEKGISLVEVLVALGISTVVAMAGYTVLISSNWSYNVQEDVGDAQQNVRMAMERLAKDIRMAGFGLPDPPFSLSIGGTWTAPITATNSSAGPDTITILGIGFEAGTLNQGGDGTCNGNTDAFICLSLPDPPDNPNINNFFNGSTFVADRKYINLGGGQYIELATAGHVKGSNKLMLGSPATLSRDYADGTQVYIIQAVQYTIDTASAGCSETNPCLASNDLTGLRGGGNQVIAESIEDIQFAYGIDANPRDRRIDDSDDADDGGFTNTDYRFSEAGDAAITDPSSIIAVRANIVAKTKDPDPNKKALFIRPALEDRTASGPERYRRRVLTKVIKLRNPRAE